MGKDALKWILIAGALYLVYRWYQAQQAQQSVASGTAPEAGEQPAAGQAPSTSTSLAIPERRQDFVPLADLSANKLHDYARSRMGAGWDGTLNLSEWNWMVSQMTGTDQQTDLSFGSDPGQITAADYLSRRVQAGISGLGLVAGNVDALARAFGTYRPPVSGWSM